MRLLLLRSQSLSGDDDDLVRLSRKMLNRTTSSRIISKQECMVENSELPLTLCSELIHIVSITGSSRVTTSESGRKQSMLSSYSTRNENDQHLSLCQFVHKEFNRDGLRILVPHFVGLNNAPTYPVSPSYARSTLIIHVPWRDGKYHKMNDSTCVKEFHQFLDRSAFPRTVMLNYLQAKNRYEHQMHRAMTEKLPRDSIPTDDDDYLDDEDRLVLKCMTTMPSHLFVNDSNDSGVDKVFTGRTYDWSARRTVSTLTCL